MAESDTAGSFNLKAGLTIDIYQDIVSYITLSHVQNTYKSYTDIVSLTASRLIKYNTCIIFHVKSRRQMLSQQNNNEGFKERSHG